MTALEQNAVRSAVKEMTRLVDSSQFVDSTVATTSTAEVQRNDAWTEQPSD
jgi:hypothetical protein